MIHFFNNDLSSYEEFNLQAKPYKFEFNIISIIMFLNIIFYLLYYFNPQKDFELIFNITKILNLIIFGFFFTMIGFLSNEQIAEVVAKKYIQKNMLQSSAYLNPPFVNCFFSVTTILTFINMIIFYHNQNYIIFSLGVMCVLIDSFKSLAIRELVKVEIGKQYREKMNKIPD